MGRARVSVVGRARVRARAICAARPARSRAQYACVTDEDVTDDAPVCLIVNPSAGGGRAGRALDGVLCALEGHGLTVRAERTRDLEHARSLARRRRAGRNRRVPQRRRDDGAVADTLREIPGALLGVLPGGRGNDLARVLGIRRPRARVRDRSGGFARELDLGEVGGTAFVGIASAGFDSDANRIANEAPSRLGNLVYPYGALRALAGGAPRALPSRWNPTGRRPRVSVTRSSATASRRPTRGPTAGDAVRARCAARRRPARRDGDRARQQGQLPDKILPKVFRGTHVRSPRPLWRARVVEIAADRPFTLYADGDPIAELPARVRRVPAAP